MTTQGSSIDCPRCGARAPDWTKQCPFCGYWIDPSLGDITGLCCDTPPWVWRAYYGMAILWIVTGAFWALLPLLGVHPPGPVGVPTYDVIAGCVSVIAGIGLISRIEAIRGVVNVLCWIQILLGLLGTVLCIVLALETGGLSLMMLVPVINVAGTVFMVWLLAETDCREPIL